MKQKVLIIRRDCILSEGLSDFLNSLGKIIISYLPVFYNLLHVIELTFSISLTVPYFGIPNFPGLE